MNKNPRPADSPVPPATSKQPSLLRIAAFFNTTAVLTTTALVAAIEPKSPPFRGD